MAYNYEFPYVDPNFYNDDWLLSKMKEIVKWMENTDEWMKNYQEAYEQLMQMIEDIESGTFPQPVIDAFTKWMQENGLDLVGELVKMVFFGITDDGYFVAYIPEHWDEIIFNTTGYDISAPGYDFGHLVLSYAIGGN